MKTDETDTIKGDVGTTDNTTKDNGNTTEKTNSSNADKDNDKNQEEIKKLLGSIESDEEQPLQATVTLTKILGGEFLNARVLRKQMGLVALIMFFIILYVSNRYSCDQQRLKIASLNKELEEAKFKAMSSTSDLTRISRESNVLNMLQQNKDSVLHTPSQPPYIINVPEE